MVSLKFIYDHVIFEKHLSRAAIFIVLYCGGIYHEGEGVEGEAYIKNYHAPDFARIPLAHLVV